MNNLDIQLENLDEQLLSYEPKIRWALDITVASGIILAGWMLYFSDSLNKLDALQEQNKKLVEQIVDNSPEAYREKIAKNSADIVAEEHRSATLEEKKQLLLSQMRGDSTLVFDNRNYAAMLDLLLERSIGLELKIELMESEDTNKIFYGKVKQFKKLTITGTGNFPDIASFLKFIESKNSLIQIESVQIRSQDTKPRFVAVVLCMGVEL